MSTTSNAVSIALPELAEPQAPRLVSRAGASVAITVHEGEERIEVRDAESRLVFELDPRSGRTVVSVPSGDLVLSASGDVEILAGRAVRCHAAERIELEAGRGEKSSFVILGDAMAEVSARALRVVAQRADLTFTEAACTAARFLATLDDAKLVGRRVETVTERLFERAKSVFRTVEDLSQLKAGRSRTLVDEGYTVQAGHVDVAASEEMKLDGKTIHLG